MALNVCNKDAVAERTLTNKSSVSEAMVHFTFLLLLCDVAVHMLMFSCLELRPRLSWPIFEDATHPIELRMVPEEFVRVEWHAA